MIKFFYISWKKGGIMKIFKNVCDLVGNTPLLDISSFGAIYNSHSQLFAKLELFNPTGSAKARPALEMILQAQNSGDLKDGSVIIEPTSGNTGIALAAIGSALGYKVIIVMPDSMSEERILLTKAYGAEVILTEGSKGMSGAIEKALALKNDIPCAFIPSQFDNPYNPLAHYKTTGPEIWNDTDGKVDILVAAIGTGGTLSGTGKYLKEKNPNIKIYGVEPLSSPILNGGSAAPHKIQGIGANFIPKALDTSIYDGIIDVSDEDAFKYAKEFALSQGIAVGISSGAALCGAICLSQKEENKGKNIVVILPDTGERYLSTNLYR